MTKNNCSGSFTSTCSRGYPSRSEAGIEGIPSESGKDVYCAIALRAFYVQIQSRLTCGRYSSSGEVIGRVGSQAARGIRNFFGSE